MVPSIRMPMNIGKIHEKLKSLSWMVGEWKSITAVVNYPTMKSPVNYNENLSFTSLGQPFLNYRSLTWNTENGAPMHLESGFLRIDEDEVSVSFLIAQSFGVATVEEGTAKDNAIITNTSAIGHMKFVRQKVVRLQRYYKLNEGGQLEYTVLMETPRTPLTQHVAVLYEKCS
ncbi:THAP domain-containing protein 4-like [Anoplophora glabripennis]|uniref:THAP domain-containing protein 4-like n=1 Tax=Anoplophora glabripennis TaxID=217634 RepID=UPI0008735717|nr:THAP domain-containing protein 4-like [Anoplophora glabripennis]